MTKQTVCVQVGNLANYVAAHLWNLHAHHFSTTLPHSELDPDVLFTPSSHLSRSRHTRVPRLQIVDSTGAFGALATQTGSLIASSTATSEQQQHQTLARDAWPGSSQVFARPPIPPHHLYHSNQQDPALDDGQPPGERALPRPSSPPQRNPDKADVVRYWSDYLAPQLHHRTCQPLPAIHHNVSDTSHFATGTRIATASLLDDLYDNLRFFIEECDSFGGIVITSNADDAFAGITASYLDLFADELGSSVPTLLFSVLRADRLCSEVAAHALDRAFVPARELPLARHEARLVSQCIEHSVQYVPLSALAAAQIPVWSAREDATLYFRSAPLGLALNVALSPVSHQVGLSGVLQRLRPTTSSFHSSMYINVPRAGEFGLGSVPDVLADANGVNCSNMWNPRCVGRVGSSRARRSADGARREEVVSARGFPSIPAVLLSSKRSVEMPRAFPKALERHVVPDSGRAGGNAPRVKDGSAGDKVHMLAGLANERPDAICALNGLHDSLLGRGDVARTMGIEKSEVSELQEMLKTKAEDIASL